MKMKLIQTKGISYIEPLDESGGWYWGSDYISGDLDEAEEVFRNNHSIKSNRLIFVHYPDGTLSEPIKAADGQYFGRPIFTDGKIHILYVDFPKATIYIVRYDETACQVEPVVSLPLSQVKDCYNLSLFQSPLTLVRQDSEEVQIVWPEQGKYIVEEDNESLFARDGDKLYCSCWNENEETGDYWEKVIVRKYPTGEVIEIIPGSCMEMPDGKKWLLQ